MGELDRGRTDTAGSAGDEHALARRPRNDPAADIGALDQRECAPAAGPARVLGPGGGDAGLAGIGRGCFADALRIPADAGIDVGVVDPGRADADQHLAGTRHRDRYILTVIELVEPAIAGEEYRLHRSRNSLSHDI